MKSRVLGQLINRVLNIFCGKEENLFHNPSLRGILLIPLKFFSASLIISSQPFLSQIVIFFHTSNKNDFLLEFGILNHILGGREDSFVNLCWLEGRVFLFVLLTTFLFKSNLIKEFDIKASKRNSFKIEERRVYYGF